MTEDSHLDPDGRASDHEDALDRGLLAAFGTSEARAAAPSVLRMLEARAGARLRVHLDSPDPEGAPVRVTDEGRRLRDPSGRYRVLGEIGRGGVGVVYKGRDEDLGRDVAMKILKDEYAARPDVLARFVEEAQIGGQLQHPGIVPVYELGLHAGERPYFAMKLVKGETLAAQLARRGEPSEDRRRLLGVFEQVCQTLAYAHSRYVIHRDMKPGNVMIGAFGEVQVVDWGFAKVLARGEQADERASLARDSDDLPRDTEPSEIETVRSGSGSGSPSLPGSMLGTPAYMSPEQAQGDQGRIDTRSDVFGLGAILCEILTGAAPYRKEEGDLVLQAAKAQLEPARRRLAACGADEALVELCMECLTPARQARPPSAQELSERLATYLSSVEGRARQAEVRAAQARTRQRATLFSAIAGALILALGVGTWIRIDRQAQARRDKARGRVAAATSTAVAARVRARAAGLDPDLWAAALAGAEALAAVATGGDVVESARADAASFLNEVREQSRTALAEADRRARDAAMLENLVLLRVPPDSDHLGPDGRPHVDLARERELERLNDAYGEAFREYLGGATLFESSLESALSDLSAGEIEVELASALDHWGLVRDESREAEDGPDSGETRRMRELAARLDPGNPWRTELRALLPNAVANSARLAELAEEGRLEALGATGCSMLGDALSRAGRRGDAIGVLRRGLVLFPRDFDLCLRLARGLELLDEPRWQEAYDSYRIARSIRPDLDVEPRQAQVLLLLDRQDEAEQLLRISLARNPSNVFALKVLGLVLRDLGREQEAIASLASAIELDPDDPMAHSYLASVHYQLGDFDAAVESCRRGLELDPGLANLHVALGLALSGKGEQGAALASFQRALEIEPRSAAHCVNIGVVFGKLGKPEEELESYRQALRINPTHMVANHHLGDMFAEQGRWEEALELFRIALTCDPTQSSIAGSHAAFIARIHRSIGMVLATLGDSDEALASYHRALELAPDALTWDRLGFQLEQLGRYDEAIDSYRQGLESEPRSARLLQALSWALEKDGRLEEALATFRPVLEIAPDSAGTHAGLGQLLAANGELDEAQAHYRRAIELDPGDAPTYVNFGACLSQAGESDEAIKVYRKALELFAEQDSAFAREWTAKVQQRIDEL